MNIYYITKCPHCGEVIVSPWEGRRDETDWFTVHGSKALGEALELLKKLPLSAVAPQFCGYCGAKVPCGCDHPDPQTAYTSYEDDLFQGKVVSKR